MAIDQYKHWDGDADRGTVVVRDEENEVHIPKSVRGALQNHRYGPTVNQRQEVANRYYPVPYEHQAFPKMLFHPEYHKAEPPNRNHFKETHEWEQAQRKWVEKYDRTKLVANEKEEKRLLAKGWLAKPPEVEVPKADPNSDEI